MLSKKPNANQRAMTEVQQYEIRAVYDNYTIRVYQAFGDQIANAALAQGTFVSPPFKMNRMTWIKPSFLWMMYRAGWGYKEANQSRILAIDITLEGFEWALAHSTPSRPEQGMCKVDWARSEAESPVRVQWDPERDLHFRPLPQRTIQIGLGGEAVRLFVTEWIRRVSDVTELAHVLCDLVREGKLDQARSDGLRRGQDRGGRNGRPTMNPA